MMKLKTLTSFSVELLLFFFSCKSINTKNNYAGNFNIKKDLLLVQLDCKTDVDDLHSAAALYTLLSDSKFSRIKHHTVVGTYGTQKGLYVNPNSILEIGFKNNFTDAHKNKTVAIKKVKNIIKETLNKKGDVWIAEAGQSDFTAAIIKAIQKDLPKINTSKRIHIVQHSNWNEKSTSPESLAFVKKNTDYHKIPDGNRVGNGTAGFNDATYTGWKDKIKTPKLHKIWQHTLDLSNKYNGKDGRYNNKTIAAGGLDFSDLSEVCWILGLNDTMDVEHFFKLFAN